LNARRLRRLGNRLRVTWRPVTRKVRARRTGFRRKNTILFWGGTHCTARPN